MSENIKKVIPSHKYFVSISANHNRLSVTVFLFQTLNSNSNIKAVFRPKNANAKVKIFFHIWRIFIDLFRFRSSLCVV